MVDCVLVTDLIFSQIMNFTSIYNVYYEFVRLERHEVLTQLPRRTVLTLNYLMEFV